MLIRSNPNGRKCLIMLLQLQPLYDMLKVFSAIMGN